MTRHWLLALFVAAAVAQSATPTTPPTPAPATPPKAPETSQSSRPATAQPPKPPNPNPNNQNNPKGNPKGQPRSHGGRGSRYENGTLFTTNTTIPDVDLSVPNLSVKKIELDVDMLQADINLNANVANLVTINAGVAISIEKVNLTISDVKAELELIVRLGHLVDVVNRVFESLDLNPLILGVLNNVTHIVNDVIGAVDGLLGSIVQGDSTLSFLIDNLGNIVQQVVGSVGASPVSSIVGNYQQNMTYTGQSTPLQGGLTQKRYSYGPLNALVDIVFNTVGQVVQARCHIPLNAMP